MKQTRGREARAFPYYLKAASRLGRRMDLTFAPGREIPHFLMLSLTRAFEEAYKIGQKPVGTEIVEGVLAPDIDALEFCGLMHLTEYNAAETDAAADPHVMTQSAMNTVLTAYAALEALVLETAFALYPSLYAQRHDFRRKSLLKKFELLLAADGREGETLPEILAKVDEHRQALTHSEPDNLRSRRISEVTSGEEATQIAADVRAAAGWLWKGRRPSGLAHDYERLSAPTTEPKSGEAKHRRQRGVNAAEVMRAKAQ